MARRLLIIVAFIPALACSDTGVATQDTGASVDTAAQDTGAADTAVKDTGTVDSGVKDTGVADSGSSDANLVDTLSADASVSDVSSDGGAWDGWTDANAWDGWSDDAELWDAWSDDVEPWDGWSDDAGPWDGWSDDVDPWDGWSDDAGPWDAWVWDGGSDGDIASWDADAPPDVWAQDVPPDGADDPCWGLDPDQVYPPAVAGCGDGTREGFLDIIKTPNLAACGGAWSIPGVHETVPACNNEAGNTGINAFGVGCNVADVCAPGWHVCKGKDDVDAHNPHGCDEIMKCAPSPAFFVARTSSSGAFNCAPDTIGQPQSLNDIFGCGDLGCPATQATCAPLTLGSHDKCKSLKNKPTPTCSCVYAGELPPNDPKYKDGDMETVVCKPNSGGCGWCKPLDYWSKKLGTPFEDNWDCGTNTTKEAENVTKSDPFTQGGVLCCKTF